MQSVLGVLRDLHLVQHLTDELGAAVNLGDEDCAVAVVEPRLSRFGDAAHASVYVQQSNLEQEGDPVVCRTRSEREALLKPAVQFVAAWAIVPDVLADVFEPSQVSVVSARQG